MAMKRKRRIRSPHPGVRLNRRTLPSGAVQWRLRYVDPDSGKQTDETIDSARYTNAEARKLLAVERAKSIAARKRAIDLGAQPVGGQPLEEALAAWLQAAQHRLRAKTLTTYGLAFDRLRAWAKRDSVRRTDELTRARLAALRDYLISAPMKEPAKGEKGQGKRRLGKRTRSALSVNRELRSLKTLLGSWVDMGMVRMHREDIARALKALPVEHEQAEYLAPAALQKLLQAALRHDAAVYDATRLEHAGVGTPGSTPRYDPIAPFAAFVLLTGCRRAEALGLRWDAVDLDAVDATGTKVGEIRIAARASKTHRGRTIGLEVSPGLRAMLAAMKLRAGRDAVHVFERRLGGKRAPYTGELIESARRRLVSDFGAPPYAWQTLRSSCATYLTCSSAIFGAATVFLSARQLGHSVAVAERHYLGVHRGIPREARTLEAAMQIEGVLAEVLASVQAAPARKVASHGW